MHGDDVQAVEEVLPEGALAHQVGDVAVAGGNEAHVDLDRRLAPDAAELARLQHPQEVDLVLGGSSLTSSRKRVPPWAISKRPGWALTAPVKAPSSWPKSLSSKSWPGRVPQLTAMKGPSARRLFKWMILARISLPVPDSPVIRTVAL